MSSKPLVTLISDVHYSLNTYKLADIAFRVAIDKAAELRTPLIDAGDLTNDKAILRGEVVNTLIDTMKYAKSKGVEVTLLVGNHSLVNEKGKEHVLNFLRPYAKIVDSPERIYTNLFLIPYQSDHERFKEILSESCKPGSIIITHQGFKGAFMGDYVQDKSSVDPELVKDFTVLSGHYHKHQQLQTVTYIGNPYTLTFGEANDPPKGFLILNSDGTFTREILNLRKHVIVERDYKDLDRPEPKVNPDDLLWLRVTGPKSELVKIKKADLGTLFLGHSNFKLDLIPNDPEQIKLPTETMTDTQVFDHIIESLDESDDYKTYLKELWREIA